MSRIITNTNIIVDDFDFAKSFPKDTFIHFLTHFHSDHYEGLSPLWNYGPIHCSHQTKKFMMNKYPKLQRVSSYDYNKKYTIECVQKKFKVNFYLFDAKHIPGSSMILFQGPMGTIFFTGDFRYEYQMIL
jgi:Cft2 family RNA processing exonuclease